MPEVKSTKYHARMPARERDPRISKAFGRALRIGRVRQGLTQDALAKAAQLERATLGRIERGERDPALVAIVRLARSLGMTPGQLMDAMETEHDAEARGPGRELTP